MNPKKPADSPCMLYIHIPFCVKKCAYCDFLSMPADKEVRARYVARLTEEIRKEGERYGDSFMITSLYIGGGTPTLPSEKELESLLLALRQSFSFAENAECTIEANPGTASFEKLQCLQENGINRLSLGLQSAHEKELSMLGRIHTCADFEDAYLAAVRAGFTNINVDVMSALPGQTWEVFEKTLSAVLDLTPPPTHLSVYQLIVEEGTPFASGLDGEGKRLPSAIGEEEQIFMYENTVNLLQNAGYMPYEISNFARPGMECKHNVGYWSNASYIGLGLGAASCLYERPDKGVRLQNQASLDAYLSGDLTKKVTERIGKKEAMEEFCFLGLRKTKGVSMAEFKARFGESMEGVYGKVLETQQHLGLIRQAAGQVALTARGRLLSNRVLAAFLL